MAGLCTHVCENESDRLASPCGRPALAHRDPEALGQVWHVEEKTQQKANAGSQHNKEDGPPRYLGALLLIMMTLMRQNQVRIKCG